jgi:hypothetical protein
MPTAPRDVPCDEDVCACRRGHCHEQRQQRRGGLRRCEPSPATKRNAAIGTEQPRVTAHERSRRPRIDADEESPKRADDCETRPAAATPSPSAVRDNRRACHDGRDAPIHCRRDHAREASTASGTTGDAAEIGATIPLKPANPRYRPETYQSDARARRRALDPGKRPRRKHQTRPDQSDGLRRAPETASRAATPPEEVAEHQPSAPVRRPSVVERAPRPRSSRLQGFARPDPRQQTRSCAGSSVVADRRVAACASSWFAW